jgi:PKD repeat protein
LREIKLDSQNRIQKINSFLPCGQANVGPTGFDFECDNPMDMQFGKDGSFYLLTYGDGFFAANLDAGLYRWDYVKGQRAPKTVIKTDKTDGPAPLTVKFTGSGSSDDDPGDSIRFEWDFGDGSPLSTEPDPTHTYTKAGRYTAILSVTDSTGAKTAASTIITVGNTSPTVTVTAPIDGGLFSFGDKIQYKVTVTDPEDATVNCNDVTVTFVLGHDTHGHAEQSSTGCTGFLQTDAGDVSHGGNVFGVISATYTDKGGPGGVPTLSTTNQVQIRQKHQEVEFVVSQSGTATATNTDGATGAGVHRSSLGAADWVQLNGPFNLFQADTISFRVADAAAGRTAGSPLAAIEIRQDSSTGPILTTANLVSTGGTTVWSTQTFPLPASSGKHELFFVFRAVTGGSTGGNLFNLNWAEFGGNGVTVVETNAPGTPSGTVPATLSLTLGTPAAFAPFTPGVAKTYGASTTANVISTAGDATLSVSDPSSVATGHLVNGTFSLPSALTAKASSPAGTGSAFAPVGGSANPTKLLTYAGPTSNDTVTVSFEQAIGATDALRTGSYAKTLTFTLSTTTPCCAAGGAPGSSGRAVYARPARRSASATGARESCIAAAPVTSARSPRSLVTIRTALAAGAITRRSTAARMGSRSTSPAAASSPPMTTSSGLRTLIIAARPMPTAAPASLTARRAPRSPAATSSSSRSRLTGSPRLRLSSPVTATELAIVSRQPRLPQRQMRPSSTTARWPSSPATPVTPR